MKTLFTLCILCSCATKKPVLSVLYYDPNNNRVTEDGQLVAFTNWAVGFTIGTNQIKLIEAQER